MADVTDRNADAVAEPVSGSREVAGNGRSLDRSIVHQARGNADPELQAEKGYVELASHCRSRFAAMVKIYWEIGKRIDRFLAQGDRRRRYGGRIFRSLAEDTGIDASTLYRAHEFHGADPDAELLPQIERLPWSRARQLTPLLREPAARAAVAEQADDLVEMSRPQFDQWLADQHLELLGRPLSRRGRKPNQPVAVRARHHFNALKRAADEAPFEGLIEPLAGGSGHVVAFVLEEGADPAEIVRRLLERRAE